MILDGLKGSISSTEATQSHSIATEGNSLLYTALTSPGEAMDKFACDPMTNRVTIAESDEFCTLGPERDARGFSTSTLYPRISVVQVNDPYQFMQGIPLPTERNTSSENQETLTSSCLITYPSEYTKPAVNFDSSNVNSSFENMKYGYGSLLFDTRMMTEVGCLDSNSGVSSRFSNEPSIVRDQCSEMSFSGITRYTLHNRHIVSEHASCSSSNNISLSFDSYKPFQLHPGSRFVHAMQEILAEIACYALENTECTTYLSSMASKGYPAVDFSDGVSQDCSFMLRNDVLQEWEVVAKRKHLLALLQVVDNNYNQCIGEIHTVTSAFHAITELNPNPHTKFALQTISFMYKNLRARISSYILALGSHLMEGETRKEKSFETQFIEKQWALKRDHYIWKPQRGLPERSVSVLRAWMFQNFLHPYPKDAEKHLLALKSGLTRNQVSNWFINARVRLWKPMIEEMYAEMNKKKARQNNDEQTDDDRRNYMQFENTRFTRDSQTEDVRRNYMQFENTRFTRDSHG